MTDNNRAAWAYSNTFYDYIEKGVLPSARAVVGLIADELRPVSVLDVGCGRGLWLKNWKEKGARDVMGVDGAYVDALRLHIARDEFRPVDLSSSFALGRKFDLVQSLEVAEHLPPLSSVDFIASLVAHGDIIVFSAAVPGQGGENHQNERPLSFWRSLFERHGFAPYDPIRPHLAHKREIEPWYRFNTLLYANEAGRTRLPTSIAVTRIVPSEGIAEFGDLSWRLRRAVVSLLPRSAVDFIARRRAQMIAARLAQDAP